LDEATDEIESTMIMDTSKYRSMVDKGSPKTGSPQVASARKIDTIAVLRFLDGGGGQYKCRTSITKIGKHRDSDIVVKGFMVGRTSATITKRPDGFYLSYVGGMSHPKVNGTKVKREMILDDSDVIEIGTTKLQFFERKPRKPKEKKLVVTQPIPQVAPERQGQSKS